MSVELSVEEREAMEHATAWRHKRRLYRNHFVTGPDTIDWPIVFGLVERGLMKMTRSPSELSGGMQVFAVTDAGIAALTAGPTSGGAVRRALHWVAHIFGMNACCQVGHLDHMCIGCGRLYPASEEFRNAMAAIVERDVATARAQGGQP